ncbi:hypothetical protein QWY99_12480 [Flavobacterium branchiarum]|uniref:Uncharacterized protein n=1 Tax=Flavobacterium branchiarum TaxID=1114870 RepID=A0ABV5FHE1_9FLAO|nr:hypothetical protein [Flavobacterium branchiarum]MDN3673867.1 hypothetical protein [Flavobacterium branchiarum]
MKFYTFFNTDELNTIGDYPQIEKSENYNLSSPDSYWNVPWNQFPNFKPLYSIKIRDKALNTNFLHSLPGFKGLTIDDNLKNIIEKFNLPPHQFYKIEVVHRNQELKYHWFHFIESLLGYIDFEKTTFELFQKWPLTVLKEIKVSSIEELHKLEVELNFEKEILIKKIALLDTFPNYDIISLNNITPLILVSEKLKKTLEESELKGFEFKEYKQLVMMEQK